MNKFLLTIENEFTYYSDPVIAAGQKAYMKNQFDFHGIKTPRRREIQKPFLNKKYLPPKSSMVKTVKTLWSKNEREYQYFAVELALAYANQMERQDISLFEYMITHKSWWDTVDSIAAKLVGSYFIKYPEQRDKYVEKWLKSENIWLQRTAILFQLNYKDALDTSLLSHIINTLLGSKEFFINKAIGWILRQYGKTNPDWVIDFVNKTQLDNLSRREALRLIEKTS